MIFATSQWHLVSQVHDGMGLKKSNSSHRTLRSIKNSEMLLSPYLIELISCIMSEIRKWSPFENLTLKSFQRFSALSIYIVLCEICVLRDRVIQDINHHHVTSFPCIMERIRFHRFLNLTIDELYLVLRKQCKFHWTTPCVIVRAIKSRGNEDHPWIFSRVQIEWVRWVR